MLKDIILNIYRELYNNSTPKADFDELVSKAKIDEQGRKIIPFMDYEIYEEDYIKIVQKHIPKNYNKFKKEQIKATIALGCSPKFKIRTK